MVTIDNASNGVFGIGTAIGLEGGFIEIILVFGIGEGSGIGLKVFNVLLNLLEPFLLF